MSTTLQQKVTANEQEIVWLKQQNAMLQSTLNEFIRKVDRFMKQITVNNVSHLYGTRSHSPDTAATSATTTDSITPPNSTRYSHPYTSQTDDLLDIKEEKFDPTQPMKITTKPLKCTDLKELESCDVSTVQCHTSEIITIIKESVFKKLTDYYNTKGQKCAIDKYQESIMQYIGENKIDSKIISSMNKANFVKNIIEYISNKTVIGNTSPLKSALAILFLILKNTLEFQRMDINNQMVESHIPNNHKDDMTTYLKHNSYVISYKIRNVARFVNISTGNFYVNKPSILDIAKNKLQFNFTIYPSGRKRLQKNFVQCVLFLSSLPQNIESITLCIHMLLVTKSDQTKREFKSHKTFSKKDDYVGWNAYTLPLEYIKTQNKMGCNEFVFECIINPLSLTNMKGKVEKLDNS